MLHHHVIRSRPLAILLALLALIPAAPASAAPLSETEPNDDALHANGPIPADGFTSTINVSDDIDYFILRLQGRRQVKITLQQTNQCAGNYYIGVDVELQDADGHSWTMHSGGTIDSRTFTTPRDATEYIGKLSGQEDCQVLFKAEPADAIITGPLPPPSYNRSLDITAAAAAAKSVSFA